MINSNNVHQSSEVIFGGKDIHSSLGVVGEKVEDLPLNMCSILQSNNYNNVPKCVVGCCTITPIGAPKQMGI
jgi:hypothetical protein